VIGNLLDKLLMEGDNMEVWETCMTAGERRVLISNYVAKANELVLASDEARMSCFWCCGTLLTLEGTGNDKIKPQSCTKLPLKIPQMVDLSLDMPTIHRKLSLLSLESGIVNEDFALHCAQPEGDQVDAATAVCDKGDDDVVLPVLPELPSP
jgi:hypothetical protein